MRKLTNNHFKIAALLILSSTASLSALAQPPASGAMSYASPEAALYAYRAARDRQDWRTAYLCFTPGFQHAALLEAYFACRASNDPQLPAIMKQYGADEPSVDAEYGNRYRTKYGNGPLVMPADAVMPKSPSDAPPVLGAFAWFGSAAWPMYRREVTPQPVSGLAPKYTGASASPYLNKNPTPNHLYPEPSDSVAIYRGGNLRRSEVTQTPLSGTGAAAPAGNVTARVYVAGKSWLHGSKVIPMRGGGVPPPSGQIAVPIYRGGLLQTYRVDAVPPDDPEPAMAPSPAPMEYTEGTGLN